MPQPPAPVTSSSVKGYAIIHGCVVLFGFTPIMGRLITLHAVPLVWWRMSLAALALLLIPATWHGIRRMSPRVLAVSCLTGIVLAISWVLFYLSVKLSNASVAAVCLAVAPLFVVAAGPFITHRPYRRSDLLLALLIIPGIALVVGGVPSDMGPGLWVGLLSAAILTVFSGLNKYLSRRAHPLSSTCIEMSAGALFLVPVLAFLPGIGLHDMMPDTHDMVLLVVFAVVLTALPVALVLVALQTISVFAQQMAINLEPVYAVLLAIPLLGEQQELGPLFYLGMVIIVGAVMVEPLLQWLRGRMARRGLARP